MLRAKNFKDTNFVPQTLRLYQDEVKTILPGPGATEIAKRNRFKPCIAGDLIHCARRRNNILTASRYQAEGRYSLEDVTCYYGSFDNACTALQIINPDNIEDYAMVAADIHNVREFCGKIDADTYKDNGAYPFEALDKRYGFQRILVKEGLIPVSALYPSYPVKKNGVAIAMRSVATYEKRLFGSV